MRNSRTASSASSRSRCPWPARHGSAARRADGGAFAGGIAHHDGAPQEPRSGHHAPGDPSDDMDVAFALTDRIIGPALRQGRRRRSGSGRPRRTPFVQEIYLGDVLMLEVRDIHTYYGNSHVLQGVTLSMTAAGRGHPRAQRNGQDHADPVHHRLHAAPSRTGPVQGPGHHRVAVEPRGGPRLPAWCRRAAGSFPR